MRDILEEMRKEAAEKAAERAAKKAAEEAAHRTAIEIAVRVIASKKLTLEEIAEDCGLPLSEVKALAADVTT